MLDLNRLEEKLDLALVNETSASLKQWLREKRMKRFFDSLASGVINNLVTSSSDVSVIAAHTNFVNQMNAPFISSKDYAIAA